jgi:hypothetical protein
MFMFPVVYFMFSNTMYDDDTNSSSSNTDYGSMFMFPLSLPLSPQLLQQIMSLPHKQAGATTLQYQGSTREEGRAGHLVMIYDHPIYTYFDGF